MGKLRKVQLSYLSILSLSISDHPIGSEDIAAEKVFFPVFKGALIGKVMHCH